MGDTVISLRDWKIFEKVIPRYIRNTIDIDQALILLCTRGYITIEDKQNLGSISHQISGYDRNRKLLSELLKLLDFDTIVIFLHDIGQNAFANDLKRERYGTGILIPEHGTDIAVTRATFHYYNNLKIQMDNNIFKYGRIYELGRRSRHLKNQLRTEQNPERRQRLANRYAVVTYQKVAQYRGRDERVRILEDMKKSLPPDVDPNFTNIIYLCKMAVTEMHAGNEETARQYMIEAFTQCDCCNQTFVKAFLFHDLQFVSRILDSVSPADKHLKDTISGGDLGLLFMKGELDESSQIWSRVFLSENAMGLLNIRSNFKVLVEEKVEETDIRHAEQLLAHLLRSNASLEIRREMIYNLCQARVSELKENIVDALEYAYKAKDLAKEGVHFENDKANIDDYYDYLCSKGVKNNQAEDIYVRSQKRL